MLIQMDMNTAETLIGCGEKLGLIMVQVAKALMEIEIGDFIGEVSNYKLRDVLWGQPIKLIQVVSTSEFHEY